MQERTDVPFVFTDSYSSVRRINNVGIDDFAGGRLAAECLADAGHRRLAFLAPGLYESELDNQRMEGFQYALGKRGISLPPENYLLATDGETLADAFLALPQRPTGVFVTADVKAITLMGALQRRGVRVPEDVSVVGFDDIPIARHITPALTTIHQDIARKAEIAVEILMRHLKEPGAPMENVSLDIALVTRDSVRTL
jgi:LacI family transcriptional regulator